MEGKYYYIHGHSGNNGNDFCYINEDDNDDDTFIIPDDVEVRFVAEEGHCADGTTFDFDFESTIYAMIKLEGEMDGVIYKDGDICPNYRIRYSQCELDDQRYGIFNVDAHYQDYDDYTHEDDEPEYDGDYQHEDDEQEYDDDESEDDILEIEHQLNPMSYLEEGRNKKSLCLSDIIDDLRDQHDFEKDNTMVVIVNCCRGSGDSTYTYNDDDFNAYNDLNFDSDERQPDAFCDDVDSDDDDVDSDDDDVDSDDDDKFLDKLGDMVDDMKFDYDRRGGKYINKKHTKTTKKHTKTTKKHTKTTKKHTKTNKKHTKTNKKHTKTNKKHTKTNKKHTKTNKKHTKRRGVTKKQHFRTK